MKFKSLDEFLQSFTAPIENITPKKLKRMSKTYFIMLGMFSSFSSFPPFLHACDAY